MSAPECLSPAACPACWAPTMVASSGFSGLCMLGQDGLDGRDNTLDVLLFHEGEEGEGDDALELGLANGVVTLLEAEVFAVVGVIVHGVVVHGRADVVLAQFGDEVVAREAGIAQADDVEVPVGLDVGP